jgi:drug efflux transport system ATP-binding protein
VSSAPVVVADKLARRFGAVRAVDAVSFSVREGELFGLVGPDGAGKTTLLRMLAGVLKPSGGDAQIFDASIVRAPEAVKHDIAYMPQRFGLYVDLTVSENLAFYADLYSVPMKERPARLERLYHFSNLGPFRDRLAGQLSGGMKQKLALSCALVHQPRLLLLDEPTFGVDPISRRDLWLIVHEMVEQGVTAIVSTAYMDEAERFDRVALLHQGSVLAIEAPERLQQSLPGTVLAIETDAPRRVRDVLTGNPLARRVMIFGDTVHVTVGSERDARGIERALRSAGVPSRRVTPVEASFEDVFIARLADHDGAGASSP